MSEILDRLLQLRDENSIEYLEDDSKNAKEYQKLKLKCEQSLKLQELVKEKKKEYTNYRVNWGLKSPNGDQQWGIIDLNDFVHTLLQSLIKDSKK